MYVSKRVDQQFPLSARLRPICVIVQISGVFIKEKKEAKWIAGLKEVPANTVRAPKVEDA